MERKVKPSNGAILLGILIGILIGSLLLVTYIYANSLFDGFIRLVDGTSRQLVEIEEGR